jgi:hypothetical protein
MGEAVSMRFRKKGGKHEKSIFIDFIFIVVQFFGCARYANYDFRLG